MRDPTARRRRPGLLLDGWLLAAVIVLAWELTGRTGLLNELLFPRSSRVAAAWWHLFREGELARDAGASIGRVLAGVSLAAVAGVSAGVAVTLVRPLRRQLRNVLEVLRPIPPIAWIPLAILWFGIGPSAAVFVVALGAFFPIFVNTAEGLANVRSDHVNAARCLGAGPVLLVFDVLLPAALPQILAGLQIGIGVGWMSVIAAELVGAQSGLGYMIQLNRVLLRTENIIAGMLTIGMLGYAMHRGMNFLQRVVAPWSRTAFEAGARGEARGWEPA